MAVHANNARVELPSISFRIEVPLKSKNINGLYELHLCCRVNTACWFQHRAMDFAVPGMLVLLFVVAISLNLHESSAQVVPAIYIFGDSTVDAGNNDYIETVVKANFPPYGRDFDTHKPTGRFCNGRIGADYLAEMLGLPFAPAYLDPQARGSKIIRGVNFATSGSGIYNRTNVDLNVPNLIQQLSWFRDHKHKLIQIVGQSRAASILSQAIFILSSGSNDYINNYYVNPVLQEKYRKDAYRGILIQSFESFAKELYQLGARRIVVLGLIPLGCIPSQVTLYGKGQIKCIEFENRDAFIFNQALQSSVHSLRSSIKGLKLAYVDVYTLFSDVIKNPLKYGFKQTLTACCGVGRLAVSFLCNKFTPGTCHDASKHVFWDSFHPTDAMYKIVAKNALEQVLPYLLG